MASIIAKKSSIESRVFKSTPNDLDLKVIQWMENQARKDLSLYNKLMNVQAIRESYQLSHSKKLTAIKLSQIISCSRQYAQYYIGILNNKVLIDAISQNKITTFMLARELIDIKSLEALDLFLKSQDKDKNKKIRNLSVKKASPEKTFSLGSTRNSSVVKLLIEGVLSNPNFSEHVTSFDSVDWNNHQSSTTAFRRLLKILEGAT